MVTSVLQLDNPFWSFSLAVYAQPGVADECLALQDSLNVDVNVLLFCAWAGADASAQLTDANFAIIDEAIARWRDTVVRPLRAIRRSMKRLPDMTDPTVADAYKDMLTVELRTEQIEQALLFETAPSVMKGAAQSAGDAITENIVSYLRRHAAGADVALPHRLIEAARSYRP